MIASGEPRDRLSDSDSDSDSKCSGYYSPNPANIIHPELPGVCSTEMLRRYAAENSDEVIYHLFGIEAVLYLRASEARLAQPLPAPQSISQEEREKIRQARLARFESAESAARLDVAPKK